MALLASNLTGDDFVERYLAWVDRHYLLTGINQESFTSAGFFKNYLFFYALPDLLAEKMEKLDQGSLRQVQSWSFFTALFVRQFDTLVDGCPGEHLFNQQRKALAFFSESDAQLREIFPPAHSFWDDFKLLYKRFFNVLEREISLNQQRPAITWDEYAQHAIDKACISEGVTLALCHLAGNFENFEPFTGALRHFNVSLQILDDIPDIWEDETAGRWNYFGELLNAFLDRENVVAEKTPGNQSLRKYYYLSGVPAEGYRRALWHLDQIPLCLDKGRLSDSLRKCVAKQSDFCRKQFNQIDGAVSDAFLAATAPAV